ncbi:MAG: PLD nuclease N-terminal domain-containing protein [Candidatus Nomurabacteria bacterium]|jgi:hypothetical protein|nr:PLD nuclease N-terminal domain-containing protein [Candidatus Nomurabacteria bacterium]
MKRSDWAMIILVVAIVGFVSYFIVGALLPNPVDNPETVETATTISSSVAEPSEKVFGGDSFNPAVETSSDSLLDEFFRINPTVENADNSEANPEGN